MKKRFLNYFKPVIHSLKWCAICFLAVYICFLAGLLDHWETGALSWMCRICFIPYWPDHYQSELRLSPPGLKYVGQIPHLPVSKAPHAAQTASRLKTLLLLVVVSTSSYNWHLVITWKHVQWLSYLRFYEENTSVLPLRFVWHPDWKHIFALLTHIFKSMSSRHKKKNTVNKSMIRFVLSDQTISAH